MPYKDKEQQREYQREYQRMRRAGENKTPRKTLNHSDILTAEGVRGILSSVLCDVMAWEGDTLQRARCAAYVAGVAIKAIEVCDLEQRITELEELTEGVSKHGH